ncbi:MAG: IclR family transcriptional regulator [Lautropia sp.]
MTEQTERGAGVADGGTEGMKSLRTALRLLMMFAGEQRDYGVGELAERAGLSKSQVSKVLAAFGEAGLLVQNPESRRYSVGVRMFALGSRFVTYDRLCREAMPVMRELVAQTGHSARLSVLDGDNALYLLGFEGPFFVDTGWRAGTWLPVHASSAGRVMLAFSESHRAERVMASGAMRAITDRTVIDPAELRRIIDLARWQGYSVQRGETSPGLGVISVPVFGEGMEVVATLGFAFPAHLVAPADEPDLVAPLHEAARILSQRIGGTVYPFGRGPAARPAAATGNGPAAGNGGGNGGGNGNGTGGGTGGISIASGGQR